MNNLLLYLFKYFVIGQIVLLPVLFLYGFIRRVYTNYKEQWILHRVILLLTLLIPIYLISKPFLMPAKQVVNTQITTFNGEKVNYIIDEYEVTGLPAKVSESSENILKVGSVPFATMFKFVDFTYLLNQLPQFIMVIGILLLIKTLLWEFIILYKVKRSIKSSIRYNDIPVVTSNRISSAFSYGILKPTIFLPTNINEDEKSIILIHELNHIKENHLFWVKFEVVLKKLFWFNPVYYVLNLYGNELRELVCDEKSINQVSVKDYGKALINSAKSVMLNRDTCCTYWGGGSILKKRINNLVGDKKIPKGLNRVSPIVFLISVMVLTLFVPVSSFAVEKNIYKEFLKLSDDMGALIAHRTLNVRDVVEAIPSDKREKYPLAYPMKGDYGRITLPWGFNIDPFTGNDYFHTAIDMGFGFGKHIVASGDGEVVATGYQKSGYGNYILIEHSDNFFSFYSQMQNPAVKKGQKVKLGDYLGEMGSSGRSTGPHLHYGVFHTKEKNYLIELLDDFQPITRYSMNPYYFLPRDFTKEYKLLNYKYSITDENGKFKEYSPSGFDVKDVDGKLEFTRRYIHE